VLGGWPGVLALAARAIVAVFRVFFAREVGRLFLAFFIYKKKAIAASTGNALAASKCACNPGRGG
jgi:hypothetical protein